MPWINSDYITEVTLAERERKLRLHLKEVSEAITVGYQSDGTAVNPSAVQQYRKDLMDELNELKGGGSKLTRGRILKL